jgi:hypothetical protein
MCLDSEDCNENLWNKFKLIRTDVSCAPTVQVTLADQDYVDQKLYF